MARVKLNPVLEQMRGQIGDLVFKRYGDDVVVARKPEPASGEATPAQQATREHFRQAALYGKLVMADPATKPLYDAAAKAKGKPVFSLAVADFFHAPEVNEVDLSAYSGAVGDEIIIQAWDDFGVTGVEMTLTNPAGDLLERGAAVESPTGSGRWVYAATTAVAAGTTVRLTVTAHDRPGNVTIHEADRTV